VKRRLGCILFIVYCGFLLWLTILSRQPREGERIFKWELLWSYRAWIAGESFGRTESIQNINNILVFIPFGVLFPGRRWRDLFITAALFSAAIEAVQYAANLGWCEIDDVICNVLGAAIGFGLWKLIKGKVNAV
jgi:glycopeptide antibiotics resistance protein